jgi:glutamine synthetase
MPRLLLPRTANPLHARPAPARPQDGKSVTAAPDAKDGSPQLSEPASAFFGGVLAHLPALLPFASPSCGADWGSYARLRPGCWAGAFACWGWDNREAPLRATRPGGPETTNVEFKPVDGTTNPYIALAAVACAGALGLAGGLSLPPPVSGAPEDAGKAPGGGGAVAMLPKDLPGALAAWAKDGALRDAVRAGLGEPLLRAFMAVRHGEMLADPKLADVLLRY